jgi:hypothetical protein
MLVAGPRGAPVTENGQKWPEMALHLTNYCLWPFRVFLLILSGLDGLAALSHSAGLRAACERLHRRGGEPKAIRL